MKSKYALLLSISVLALMLLNSCSKYGAKVEGTYVGEMSINGSVIANETPVIVTDRQKENVLISSSFFDDFQVELSKKRYFQSVIFYSNESNRTIEFNKSGDQILLILSYTTTNGDQITFHANKQ